MVLAILLHTKSISTLGSGGSSPGISQSCLSVHALSLHYQILGEAIAFILLGNRMLIFARTGRRCHVKPSLGMLRRQDVDLSIELSCFTNSVNYQ